MNFKELKRIAEGFDEIMPIGRDVRKEGRLYHIVGMTRRQKQASLYIVERNDDAAENGNGVEAHSEPGMEKASDAHYTHRAGMKAQPALSYFFNISAYIIGETELETEGANSGPMALDRYCDEEKICLFSEMMKAGWSLHDGHEFQALDWEKLCLTVVDFRTEVEKLPAWEGRETAVRFSHVNRCHYVEKPVRLSVGEEMQVDFALEDGREIICYINSVYLMDVWKKSEEKFNDPRYLELMSKEEIEKTKEECLSVLGQYCPRGMFYLGIEYECTSEGSIAFYDRDFLDAEPETHSGGASAMFMLLKPDEPVGKHGLKQRGCVIQKPLTPDVRQIDAELFHFMEIMPDRTELI